MAIPSVCGVFSASDLNSASLDVSVTTPSDDRRALLAFAHSMDSASPATITSVQLDPSGSNEAFTLELANTDDLGAAGLGVEGWYIVAPPASATFTVRFTWNEEVSTVMGGVLSLYNVLQSNPTGAASATSGNSSSPSVDVGTTASNARVFGAFTQARDITPVTPGTNDTEHYEIANGSGATEGTAWAANESASSTTTVNVDADVLTARSWIMIGIEVQEGLGGGGEPEVVVVPPSILTMLGVG